MYSEGIVGSIFVDNNQTINGSQYNKILHKAIPEADEKGFVKELHFEQNGVPPRRTENLNLIHKQHDGRVIAKGYPQKYGRRVRN